METGKYKVELQVIVEENNLRFLHKSSSYETTFLTTADVNRPALQLTGFYDYFDPARLQLLGIVESTYLATLTHEQRLAAFDEYMKNDFPALVLCHGVEATPECLEMAEKHDRNLLASEEDTSDLQANIITALHKYLAPRITTHGVLVEVYGEGMLILGDSGIGKSETALELIKRGHRLIADDAVEIRRIDKNTLLGSAPANIRHFMELRGIGIVNVRSLYGIGAIKGASMVEMVVKLESWQEGKAYDRLGLIQEYQDILGLSIPSLTIPVRPGRNLAVILEVAAMNNRQKKAGYNAAEALASSIDDAIDRGMF
ncbi:MAG: HPr(Ser) kinase/phosphatase [Oscillospiraceae bacterium]|nr:HPr(Ser) kinase/phosphatase [Oscillospiraceae bacterium]